MNYIKYSCIIFPVERSEYFQIIYCLQEKSTHIRLKVSVAYVISSLYVLNCLKYFLIDILEENVSKNKTGRGTSYSIIAAWVLRKITFSLIKSIGLCLRGSLSTFYDTLEKSLSRDAYTSEFISNT